MKISLLILCLSVFCLIGCQSPQPPLGVTVTVEKVVSGQTIEVLGQNTTQRERVRLLGINAPDLQQDPWGELAKKGLKQILSETVVLEFSQQEKDAFGRRLAYVWQNNILVNEELVAQGYVLADLSSNTKYYQQLTQAQEYARLMGFGIWNPENPMRLTPQEFRAKTSRKNVSN
jgi:micrococcal nuclease